MVNRILTKRERRLLPNVNIAWCYDWRGKKDDELVFMFKGAPADMLKDVFRFLCAGGSGCAKGYVIEYDHDPVRRQGHCYHRLMVKLMEWNEHFASPQDMMLLIEARLRKKTSGSLKPCMVQTFINL